MAAAAYAVHGMQAEVGGAALCTAVPPPAGNWAGWPVALACPYLAAGRPAGRPHHVQAEGGEGTY